MSKIESDHTEGDDNGRYKAYLSALAASNNQTDRSLAISLLELNQSGQYKETMLDPVRAPSAGRKRLHGTQIVLLQKKETKSIILPFSGNKFEGQVSGLLSTQVDKSLEAGRRDIDSLRRLRGIALGKLHDANLQTVAAMHVFHEAGEFTYSLIYPRVFAEIAADLAGPSMVSILPHLSTNEGLGEDVALYFLKTTQNRIDHERRLKEA